MPSTQINSTGVTFPDATSQTTARTAANTVTTFNGSSGAISFSPVTSAVAGNGIAVSGATGAVTFSLAAPSFNSIGSTVFGVCLATSNNASGTTLSAGTGNNQVQSAGLFYSCITQVNWQNNLSGTWRYMGAQMVGIVSGGQFNFACFVRVA